MNNFEVNIHDLDGLPWIRSFIFLEETPSTNTYALEHLDEIVMQSPCLIVAQRQTAGRGRGQNQWWSDQGNLTCSLIMHQNLIAAEIKGHLALLTAIAIGNAIEQTLANGSNVEYKWPNDIYYYEKKLSGILIESKQGAYVIGMGINVNQEVSEYPASLKEHVISMRMLTGAPIDFNVLLTNLLRELQHQLNQSSSRIVQEWQKKSLLQDRIVRVSTPTGEVQGRCLGVNQQGHLMVMSLRGVEEIIAGSIISFE